MTTQPVNSNLPKPKNQWQCFVIFSIIFSPVLFLITLLQDSNEHGFHFLLFIGGWISWTFIEYIYHRFWMHGEGNWLYELTSKGHRHHHRHPEDRKVTAFHRAMMATVGVMMILFSIQLHNYFTLLAGFYWGFTGFCFLHYVLHKTWSQRFFKELIDYHIYHHCKNPGLCHGVSVTWWDKLFNTRKPAHVRITERIRQFYFEGHEKRSGQ